MPFRRTSLLLALAPGLALVLSGAPLPAQDTTGIETAEGLARLVADRFSAGDSTAFAGVFPFLEGQAFVAEAIRRGASRHAGVPRVLSQDGDRAVLLLSGYTTRGNPGLETLLSRAYSDVYRAERRGTTWVLAERLHLDAESRIVAHRMAVTVVPGEGLEVADTLVVEVSGTRGFAARLNHAARIRRVTIDGRSVEPVFTAGLFWVPVGAGRDVTLAIDYRLALGDDPASSLSYALPASGFVRDQAVWHPILNYNTRADRVPFGITARIPARFRLSTSTGQEEATEDGWRVVRAETRAPVAGLSLAYDAEWEPYLLEEGGLALEVFVAPGFLPDRAALQSTFGRALRVLESRFGRPRGDSYFAVVQRREAPGSGWNMLSNAAIITGRNGGPTSVGALAPRAYMAHELAHGWTAPTGPGAFFLMEGWATFAESFVLVDEYGPEAERAFWESQRDRYERGGFEGVQSILEDSNNGGIAYSKGSWILRMLRDDLGHEVFDRGMRDYMAIPAGGDTGIPAFADALSRASGRDVAVLLRPWIEERTTPDIRVTIGADAITLRQEGPLFDLPLEIEIVSDGTSSRRSLRLSDREVVVPRPGNRAVSAVILDPDGRLLIRRTGPAAGGGDG